MIGAPASDGTIKLVPAVRASNGKIISYYEDEDGTGRNPFRVTDSDNFKPEPKNYEHDKLIKSAKEAVSTNKYPKIQDDLLSLLSKTESFMKILDGQSIRSILS